MTSSEFKATVADYIERNSTEQMPRPHEMVLIGRAEQGWNRVRIRPPYTLVAEWMVRGFILKWKVDRIAIVLPGDARGQFRVGFAERGASGHQDGISDRRLARLVESARREWSRRPTPLLMLSGRPWPIVMLVIALGLDLIVGLQRIGLTLVGRYIWLPMLPGPVSVALHFGYLALVAATIHQLWRQTRAGYVVAVLLALAQLARLATFIGPGTSALYIGEALLFPVLIGLCLLILYQARPKH